MRTTLAELEPKLKEILYSCLEDIRATKAALYLSDEEENFNLFTQYGFKETVRKRVVKTDEVVNRLVSKRTPFFVNGLATEPRFSEILYEVDTNHMLIAPIYSRGKLVGFLDLRDKAAKQEFDNKDIQTSQLIVDQILDLFAQTGHYGQRPVALSDMKVPTLADPSTRTRISTNRAVDEARKELAQGLLRSSPPPRPATDFELSAGSVALSSILGLTGVTVAGLSASSSYGGSQIVAARSEISSEGMEFYQSKLRAWLNKRGEPDGFSRVTTVHPFGTTSHTIDASMISSILSAPVNLASIRGLVLSVGLEVVPDAALRSRLEKALAQIQTAVEHAIDHSDLKAIRERIAEQLVEPDFQEYPHLAGHSKRVAELAERFALHVAIPASDVERIRLAALVHDAGMRLLDYSHLYRKATPTSDDLKLLREHPIVGAVLVGKSSLGSEIAEIVLAHHERPDGTGYPNGLIGDQIPLGSRIIHLCESFDAMTSAESYQPPVPVAAALGKIRRVAGTQFDTELARKFCEMFGEA